MEELHEFDCAMMREAIKVAKKAYAAGEVPVGAVLVCEGQIIARGYNQVELLQDATAHAEMLCITSATDSVGNWRLSDCTLYCTLEPCAMCYGAMTLARIGRLVYGAPDKRHGVCGSWVDLSREEHPIHRFPITAGVEADACAQLMVSFFRERRAEKEAARVERLGPSSFYAQEGDALEQSD